MHRRFFLAGLGLVAVAATPLTAEAQPGGGKVWRIGVTVGGFAPNPYVDALRRGLAELGWSEGKNILIDYRYAQGRDDRWPQIMADLIRLKVDVIVVGGGAGATRAAKELASVIPIVMPATYDPVAAGLVSSLARPAETSPVTHSTTSRPDAGQDPSGDLDIPMEGPRARRPQG